MHVGGSKLNNIRVKCVIMIVNSARLHAHVCHVLAVYFKHQSPHERSADHLISRAESSRMSVSAGPQYSCTSMIVAVYLLRQHIVVRCSTYVEHMHTLSGRGLPQGTKVESRLLHLSLFFRLSLRHHMHASPHSVAARNCIVYSDKFFRVETSTRVILSSYSTNNILKKIFHFPSFIYGRLRN